jgi:hypothetical protein
VWDSHLQTLTQYIFPKNSAASRAANFAVSDTDCLFTNVIKPEELNYLI